MRQAKLVWIALLIIFATIIGGCVWFLRFDYNQIIQLAIEQLQRPDIREMLEQQFFTEQKFKAAQWFARSGILISAALFLATFFYRSIICQKIQSAIAALKKGIASITYEVQGCGQSTKVILGLVLLFVAVRSIYYAYHYFPQFDECWNYNYFLSNNFFTTLVAYNNYPLHNIVTFFFLKLLPESTFVMRLPNILLGIMNTMLAFALINKMFKNEKIAIAGAAIFCVLPITVFYMLFARGIMLSMFFALLIFYILASKSIKKLSLAETILLIFICSLGSYAMISFPIFLFVILLLFMIKYIWVKDIQGLNKIAAIFSGSLVITLLLYAPIILAGGLQLGLSSPHGADTVDWQEWQHKVEEVSRNQIGFFTASYLFILINIVLIFLTKRYRFAALNIALLLIPFVVPLITKIYFPARALNFQIFAYVFTICILLEIILSHTHKLVMASCVLLLIVGFSYVSNQHTFLTWSAKPDRAAYEISKIFQQNNITSYYDKSSAFQYFVPGILYHHKIDDKRIQFFTSDERSTRFIPRSNFTGSCFVDVRRDFVPNSNKEILYEYRDVATEQHTTAKDLIVYRVVSE